MTNLRRYRPPSDEEDEFWRRLREVMVGALQEIGAEQPAIGLVVAEQLDRGNWRLMTRADLDADDQPDLATLWYRVDVEWCGEWVELVAAHWRALGVSEESARDEARWTALQNGIGLPDDLSGLDDSPS